MESYITQSINDTIKRSSITHTPVLMFLKLPLGQVVMKLNMLMLYYVGIICQTVRSVRDLLDYTLPINIALTPCAGGYERVHDGVAVAVDTGTVGSGLKVDGPGSIVIEINLIETCGLCQ